MKHKGLCILVLLLVGRWSLALAQSASFPGPAVQGNQEVIQVTTPTGTIGNTFTVEAWIYPTVSTTGLSDFANFGFTVLASSGTIGAYPLWITYWGGELRIWTWENTANYNPARTTSGAGIALNTWHHIAVTSTKGGNTTVYVDGISVLSFNNDGENNWSNQLTIGALRATRTTTNLPFFGLIDEVRVWNDIRTPLEITSNMANELDLANPTAIQGLAGYWNFNTTYTDLSPNNLTTQLLNGANTGGVQCPNVAPPITLPVELSSFTAIPTAEYFVTLHWTTQSETDALGYMIYRSQDNVLEHAIQVSPMVQATNTASQVSYEYTDMEVTPGTWYYWLQSIDYSGNFDYHGPVMATVTTDQDVNAPEIPLATGISKLYPNPFNPNLSIQLSLKEAQPVYLEIYNTRGQIVKSFDLGNCEAGVKNLNWDANGLSSGVYLIKMKAGNKSYISKAVLSK